MQIMKFFIILLLIVVKTSFVLSQNIELLHGIEYNYGKVVRGDKSIARTTLSNKEPHQKFRFSFTPFKEKNITIIGSYHTVFPSVWMKLGNDDEIKNGPFIGNGSGKTRIHRFGLGGGYKVFLWKNRIIFNPRVILNYEWAIQRWVPTSRSNSVGRYDFTMYSYSNPGYQIMPEIDIPLYFRIYKRLYLLLDYSFLWGHRPSMTMEVDYTIDGVPQPQATFVNNGTAHHAMIGLSYFFGKFKN